MDNLATRRVVDVLSFNIVGLVPTADLPIKIYMFELARAGARVFWELDCVKDAIGHEKTNPNRYMSDSLRKTWWPCLTKVHHIDEEHRIIGQPALSKSDEPFKAFVVSKTSVSTAAMLLICCYWFAHLKWMPSRNANLIWQSLLQLVPASCTFAVPLNLDEAREGAVALWADVTVRERKILPSDDMKRFFGTHRPHSAWPSVEAPLENFAFPWDVADSRKLGAVVHGLASSIDATLVKRHTQAADLLKLRNHDRFHLDPDMKAVAVAMGRTPFRASKFAKTFKLRLLGNPRRDQGADRMRYWLGARSAFTHFTTIATSIDGARFSMKDCQCGPCMNVDSGLVAWLPPVATPFVVIVVNTQALEGEPNVCSGYEKSLWFHMRISFSLLFAVLKSLVSTYQNVARPLF